MIRRVITFCRVSLRRVLFVLISYENTIMYNAKSTHLYLTLVRCVQNQKNQIRKNVMAADQTGETATKLFTKTLQRLERL